jgi:uncharacterized membrane protein
MLVLPTNATDRRLALSYTIIAVVLWSALAASLLLTVVGFARQSWKVLWLAAGLTLFFTLPAALSIGPLTLLLAAVQMGSAVAYRWAVGPLGWLALLGSALFGWLIVVPGQLAFGSAPFLFLLIPLGIIAAAAATIVRPSSRRETTR